MNSETIVEQIYDEISASFFIDSLSSNFEETSTHLSMPHYFYVASYITGTQYLHVRHPGKDISFRTRI